MNSFAVNHLPYYRNFSLVENPTFWRPHSSAISDAIYRNHCIVSAPSIRRRHEWVLRALRMHNIVLFAFVAVTLAVHWRKNSWNHISTNWSIASIDDFLCVRKLNFSFTWTGLFNFVWCFLQTQFSYSIFQHCTSVNRFPQSRFNDCNIFDGFDRADRTVQWRMLWRNIRRGCWCWRIGNFEIIINHARITLRRFNVVAVIILIIELNRRWWCRWFVHFDRTGRFRLNGKIRYRRRFDDRCTYGFHKRFRSLVDA